MGYSKETTGKGESTEGTKNCGVKLSAELWKKVRIKAIEDNITIRRALERIITAGLEKGA